MCTLLIHVQCYSTRLAIEPPASQRLARPTGFEPATLGLEGLSLSEEGYQHFESGSARSTALPRTVPFFIGISPIPAATPDRAARTVASVLRIGTTIKDPMMANHIGPAITPKGSSKTTPAPDRAIPVLMTKLVTNRPARVTRPAVAHPNQTLPTIVFFNQCTQIEPHPAASSDTEVSVLAPSVIHFNNVNSPGGAQPVSHLL